MKILFVLEHFYPYIGGAEKLFYVLSQSLAKDGYEVVVVTTRFDKKLPTTELHNGVKIIRVNCWNRFVFTFLSLPKIFQQTRKCDLIHTTSYNAALPAMIAGVLFQKTVYITFHEVWGALWKKLPFTSSIHQYGFYFFEKALLHLPFRKFIAVSNFTKNRLQQEGIPENKITRIYNGLDYKTFDEYNTRGPEVFTFTYFGRLGISKGLDILMPAVAKFKKEFPNSKFKMIIPKKPVSLYNVIITLIKEYNLEGYIEFKHDLPKSDLIKELLESSCVVIPSYSEGFCFAAAETVALKVPIISSNQGALSETVSGKFIRMEEMTVAALVEALKKAYHKQWKVTPIKYFHLEKTVKAYKALYKD